MLHTVFGHISWFLAGSTCFGTAQQRIPNRFHCLDFADSGKLDFSHAHARLKWFGVKAAQMDIIAFPVTSQRISQATSDSARLLMQPRSSGSSRQLPFTHRCVIVNRRRNQPYVSFRSKSTLAGRRRRAADCATCYWAGDCYVPAEPNTRSCGELSEARLPMLGEPGDSASRSSGFVLNGTCRSRHQLQASQAPSALGLASGP